MRKTIKGINRIIAMILVIIISVTLYTDVTGTAIVYALEDATENEIEDATEDVTENEIEDAIENEIENETEVEIDNEIEDETDSMDEEGSGESEDDLSNFEIPDADEDQSPDDGENSEYDVPSQESVSEDFCEPVNETLDVPDVAGEFSVGIKESSEKYLRVDSVKALIAETEEILVKNEDEKYEIPEEADYILIDVKTLDIDRVPVENIDCRINGVQWNQAAQEYDYSSAIVHMTIDTEDLIGKDVEFCAKTNASVIFDDSIMSLTFDSHYINKPSTDDWYDSEAASDLVKQGVKGLGESLYIYEFTDAENVNIGDVLKARISFTDGKRYENGNITFYYQVFGNKPSERRKIANLESFNITLNQANSIIVFTYEIRTTDRVYVDDNEVYDLVVSLNRDSCVKIISAAMSTNNLNLNIKDPSTATWKISSLSQDQSDKLLKVVKDDAVYLNVDDAAINALGYKQFAIERTENGKKDTWNFIINKEKPEITVKDLDNKILYAGQERSFVYQVSGNKPALTKENVKIYKADGMLADENNIQVKAITSSDITIEALAVDAATDKATYYVDIVDSGDESLLKDGKKLKLNVDVLDCKFSASNIEYVRSDEDNIYFKVKGLSPETESLYTNIVVTANAVVAKDDSLNELYKDKSVVEETFKNDDIIKIPVKENPADIEDDKSTSQDYSFTFCLL